MAKVRTELEMVNDYMEGLNCMIDASSQMVHQFQNLKFMAIRDILNAVKDKQVQAIKHETAKL